MIEKLIGKIKHMSGEAVDGEYDNLKRHAVIDLVLNEVRKYRDELLEDKSAIDIDPVELRNWRKELVQNGNFYIERQPAVDRITRMFEVAALDATPSSTTTNPWHRRTVQLYTGAVKLRDMAVASRNLYATTDPAYTYLNAVVKRLTSLLEDTVPMQDVGLPGSVLVNGKYLMGIDNSPHIVGIAPATLRKLLSEVSEDMVKGKDEGWRVCAAYYATKLIALISEAEAAEQDTKNPLNCNDCGCEIVFEYAATNRSWNRTVGTKDNPRGEGIMLCTNCFCKRAIAKGEYPYFETLFVVGSRFRWRKKEHMEKTERRRDAFKMLEAKYKSVKHNLKAVAKRLGVLENIPVAVGIDPVMLRHSMDALATNHCEHSACKAKTMDDCNKCAVGMHLKDLEALLGAAPTEPRPLAVSDFADGIFRRKVGKSDAYDYMIDGEKQGVVMTLTGARQLLLDHYMELGISSAIYKKVAKPQEPASATECSECRCELQPYEVWPMCKACLNKLPSEPMVPLRVVEKYHRKLIELREEITNPDEPYKRGYYCAIQEARAFADHMLLAPYRQQPVFAEVKRTAPDAAHEALQEVFCVCSKRSDDLFPGFEKIMHDKLFVGRDDVEELAKELHSRLDCDLVVWELSVGIHEKRATIVPCRPVPKADKPCPTCGDKREISMYNTRRPGIPIGSIPCPDCAAPDTPKPRSIFKHLNPKADLTDAEIKTEYEKIKSKRTDLSGITAEDVEEITGTGNAPEGGRRIPMEIKRALWFLDFIKRMPEANTADQLAFTLSGQRDGTVNARHNENITIADRRAVDREITPQWLLNGLRLILGYLKLQRYWHPDCGSDFNDVECKDTRCKYYDECSREIEYRQAHRKWIKERDVKLEPTNEDHKGGDSNDSV